MNFTRALMNETLILARLVWFGQDSGLYTEVFLLQLLRLNNFVMDVGYHVAWPRMPLNVPIPRMRGS